MLFGRAIYYGKNIKGIIRLIDLLVRIGPGGGALDAMICAKLHVYTRLIEHHGTGWKIAGGKLASNEFGDAGGDQGNGRSFMKAFVHCFEAAHLFVIGHSHQIHEGPLIIFDGERISERRRSFDVPLDIPNTLCQRFEHLF